MNLIYNRNSFVSKKVVRVPVQTTIFILMMLSLAHSKILINMTGPLPSSADNTIHPYLRPVFNQLGSSCGNACGTGNVFTYEMCALRSVEASKTENQFAYLYTHHFLNEGSSDGGTYHDFTDAWDIAMENGIPTVDIWGGFEDGFPAKWMSGYSKYFSAMKNRIEQYDSVRITGPSSLDTIKQWLLDHGDGSPYGGVAVVTGNFWSLTQENIKTGPHTGEKIILGFGANLNSPHAITVVGYDDSVRYDLNGDGFCTNDKDINGDNKIDMKDWETGALRIVNTWGSSFGNGGFAFLPYWTLVEVPEKGGSISENNIFFCKVRKDVTIKAALKVQINSDHRNQMALSVGISEDLKAQSPSKTKGYKKQFTYAGGDLPMGGSKNSKSIEVGLDITDLIDSIGNPSQYRAFLIVDSKKENGIITSTALIDYSSGSPQEYPSSQASVPIKQGKTLITVQNMITNTIKTKNNLQTQPLQVKNSKKALEIVSPFSGPLKVRIYNFSGQVVHSATAQSAHCMISTRNIVPGCYFLSIATFNKEEPAQTVQISIGE